MHPPQPSTRIDPPKCLIPPSLLQPRRLLLTLSLLSALLCIITYTVNPAAYSMPVLILFHVLSVILCAYDLRSQSRIKNIEHGESSSQQLYISDTQTFISDLLLALTHHILFWGLALSHLGDYSVMEGYAVLGNLVVSVMHFYMLWTQRKAKWLAKLERQPCVRCEYRDEANETAAPPSYAVACGTQTSTASRVELGDV